jgi:biotin carboxyl carrier protein
MRYFVTLGDKTVEVELTGKDVIVDGKRVDADLVHVAGTPVRHLLVDGHSHPIIAQNGAERGHWELMLGGRRISAEVVDERSRTIRAMTARTAGPQGPKPLRAPMPGLVVRVEVAPGDTVQAGQGLVIIEAMKMENELKAAAGGVVSSILVEAGQAVDKGAILVEFEK